MPEQTLRLPRHSRYAATRAFKDDDGNVFFGAWRVPDIVERNHSTHWVVAPEEEGRPDLIAHRVYQDKTLWWAIAVRNNIFLPISDIRAGMTLVCPHVDDIAMALTAARRAR